MQKLLPRIGLVSKNYKGQRIPTGYGLYLYLNLIFILLLQGDSFQTFFFFTLVTLGGLLDDLYGNDTCKGLGGHIQYFWQKKQLDSALLKILLTWMGAFFLLLPLDSFFPWDLLLLLLATNTLNLLDLRPGRAMKGFILATIPLLFFGLFPPKLLCFFIPLLLYLPRDLSGRAMLGDTGSNLLGALLGLLFLKSLSPSIRGFILLIFLFLHVLAEFYSFSHLIATNPLLRRLDQWGRRD